MAHVANKIGIEDSALRYQATTFYQYTGYVRTFLSWLKQNSWSAQREQLRAMTVWSASPDSEIQIVDKFADTVYKIRYCLVFPERMTRFSQAITGMSFTYAVQMELCPYNSLSKSIADRFDLIILHELPYNYKEATQAVENSMYLLREGGHLLVYVRKRGPISEYASELRKKMNLPNDNFYSNDLIKYLNEKDIPFESFDLPVSQDLEAIIPKFKDINFGCTMLSEVNTFQLDEKKTEEIFKDLVKINKEKGNEEGITVFLIPGGKILVEALRNKIKHIDKPPTEWFPNGLYGDFVNLGKKRWENQRKQFLAKVPGITPSPATSIRNVDIYSVIEARSEYVLPGNISLSDMVGQLTKFWATHPDY